MAWNEEYEISIFLQANVKTEYICVFMCVICSMFEKKQVSSKFNP